MTRAAAKKDHRRTAKKTQATRGGAAPAGVVRAKPARRRSRAVPALPAPSTRMRLFRTSFSLSARLKSFRYAVEGLGFMLRTQHNAWVHLAATALVVAAGLIFGLSAADWRWIVGAVALVWIAETLNTAIEAFCDLVSPEHHTAVKLAKDVGAGAVLISAGAAVAIGALTLLPYL